MRHILLLLGIAFSSAVSHADEPPALRVTLKRDGDRAQLSLREKQTLISIRSESGIGQALVERTSDRWPESIVVRLHLNGLEQLAVRSDSVKLEAAISTHDGTVRLWKEGDETTPLDETSPMWMDIRTFDSKGQPSSQFPLPDGYIELHLPRSITSENSKSIKLNWVDFFRG